MFNADGHELLPELTIFGKYDIDISDELLMTIQLTTLEAYSNDSPTGRNTVNDDEEEGEEDDDESPEPTS